MPDKDGFKNKPNCGCPKEDLERGYSNPMPEYEGGFGMVGYGEYVGDTRDLSLFQGGFLGRPMGWER